eukprot:1961063-Pleurochrysis_carterae.AAC.1
MAWGRAGSGADRHARTHARAQTARTPGGPAARACGEHTRGTGDRGHGRGRAASIADAHTDDTGRRTRAATRR